MKTKMKKNEAVKNASRKDLSCLRIPSPIGKLLLVADESALTGVYFPGRNHIPETQKHWKTNEQHPILQRAATQLRDYFDGKRTEFDLPLRLAGTSFQEKIWREIARIPFGKTLTYTELAKRVGSSGAFRAVGAAVGRNPVSIIVPCHRVLGKDGTLTGYAGGLERKQHLLRLEHVV